MSNLTDEEKKQALFDNGYFYNRELTKEELDREYEDMIEDLEMLDDISKGMDPIEAIMKQVQKVKIDE